MIQHPMQRIGSTCKATFMSNYGAISKEYFMKAHIRSYFRMSIPVNRSV